MRANRRTISTGCVGADGVIHKRLGGAPYELFGITPRPKGMWHKTYDRLVAEADEAESRAEEAFVISAGALLARIDRKSKKSSPGR